MNKTRREALKLLHDRLAVLQTEVENLTDADSIKDDLEAIRDEESEAFEAMPEGLRNTERGNEAENAVDQLNTAFDKLESIADAITTLKDDVQEALDAITHAREGTSA